MQIDRKLTDADRSNLISYDTKCGDVKDFALACLRGTHTGLGLFGSGGTGKSYSIYELMKERGMQEVTPEQTMGDNSDDDEGAEPKEVPGFNTYVVHLGRITAKGLVQELQRFPNSVHLIEDAETLIDDPNCAGVLRMALHSQSHDLYPPRRITWKTSVEVLDFYFRGSIIIVGNRVLPQNSEEFEAVKTRCPFMNFTISNPEIISKMKQMCERGYKEISAAPLTKEDCYTVLDFLLAELFDSEASMKKPMNLRVLISGFRFFALSKIERSIDWQAMLASQLKQEVTIKRGRKERIQEEVSVALKIGSNKYPSQEAKLVDWCKQTGREILWAEAAKESAEYKKGFNSAKTDFQRKWKLAWGE